MFIFYENSVKKNNKNQTIFLLKYFIKRFGNFESLHFNLKLLPIVECIFPFHMKRNLNPVYPLHFLHGSFFDAEIQNSHFAVMSCHIQCQLSFDHGHEWNRLVAKLHR